MSKESQDRDHDKTSEQNFCKGCSVTIKNTKKYANFVIFETKNKVMQMFIIKSHSLLT